MVEAGVPPPDQVSQTFIPFFVSDTTPTQLGLKFSCPPPNANPAPPKPTTHALCNKGKGKQQSHLLDEDIDEPL
jgi:hypothetical protein